MEIGNRQWGSSLLHRLSSQVWYVRPEFLQTMQNVLELKFLNNLKTSDIKELLAARGTCASSPKYDTALPYNVVGNKLIVKVEGMLMQSVSEMDAMCGGFAAMPELSALLSEVKLDSAIDHVVMLWDSPGGSAAGCSSLAKQVYDLRSTKRVTSLVTGSLCSAAYFIGSAADEIYSTDELNAIGSIGAVAMHVNQSAKDKANGLEFTLIHAGEYKTLGDPHKALSASDTKELQKSIDHCYKVFTEAVMLHRNIESSMLSSIAEGRVFHAGNAPKGLIDGLASLEDILNS